MRFGQSLILVVGSIIFVYLIFYLPTQVTQENNTKQNIIQTNKK